MTYPTSNDTVSPATDLLSAAPPALALRIVQPGTPERTQELPAGKCTVGSSGRCQICLPNAQIRPLHCLIVRSASETVVTRWAPGIQLNGQEFTSAPFVVGDCLSLGDVEMHLVAISGEGREPESVVTELPATTNEQKLEEQRPARHLSVRRCMNWARSPSFSG
jgi:hypothetical protein